VGPIYCPETLRNNPEERSSLLLRGGSLKSRLPIQYLDKYCIMVTRAKEAKKNARFQVNENTVKKIYWKTVSYL
jgi:hypothetical protein